VVHSALVEPLRRWDPVQVGGYILIGRLGAGAMGQVYLGRSAAGRLVAVKTIKVEYADEPDFRTRFSHEVAAARRVSGAFTAAVVAADPEADVPWLATAYVPAPSLSTLVRSAGPLSVPAVRWLAAGCAEALESIHGTGLVHRDLKPSNVLVSPDGPRVIDFGIARAAERIQLTLTRGAVGTPAFMAPEQARDGRHATAASDVYSLGATMLFASTGHGPYQGDTVMDVLAQLATRPPDLADLPAGLADVVTACLDPDPGKRPTSASLLTRLAWNISDGNHTHDLGQALLSGPALELIADYRRDFRPLAQPDAAARSGDDTLGSLPVHGIPDRALAVPAPAGPAPHAPEPADRALADRALAGPALAGRVLASAIPAGPAKPREASNSHAPPGSRNTQGQRPRRRAMVILGSSLAAIVLLAAGTAIGGYLAGGKPGARTGRDSKATASTTPSATPSFILPPPGVAPLPANDPRRMAAATGKPAVVLNQPTGDGNTTFVVIGAGFVPGVPITIRLAGLGVSADQPRADNTGFFSYAINQSHEFRPGPLPPGSYRVLVTAPHGVRRTLTFTVNNSPLPPGPG
jgi:Protein kinase domain